MFFEDGSVTEGKRYDAAILDDMNNVSTIANDLLKTTNRTEGFLLLWGAGNIYGFNITSTFAEELETSVLGQNSDLSLEHKIEPEDSSV